MDILVGGPLNSSQLFEELGGGRSRAGMTSSVRKLSQLGLVCETRTTQGGNHYVDRNWELTEHVEGRVSPQARDLLLRVTASTGPMVVSEKEQAVAEELVGLGLAGQREENGQYLMWLKQSGLRVAEQLRV